MQRLPRTKWGRGLFLVTAVVAASGLACPGPAGSPLPFGDGGVLVQVRNDSGLYILFEADLHVPSQPVRHSQLVLGPEGGTAMANLIRTFAQSIDVTARISDANGSALAPHLHVGDILLQRTFTEEADYPTNGTLLIVIPEPEAVPNSGPDCNGNGVVDVQDIAQGTSHDCNGDAIPDECQTDTDGDGTIDPCDGCPNDSGKIAPGMCGCGHADTDSDGDSVADCVDGCPNDPLLSSPGVCGCGVSAEDSDHDGTPDCVDGCPQDASKTAAGVCGCGEPDTDSDGDGVPDCVDGCPQDPGATSPGLCGCGIPETDGDRDGTPDCIDGCPEDHEKTEPGICGCGVVDDPSDDDEDGVPNCIDLCPGSDDHDDCNENGIPDACDNGPRLYWTEPNICQSPVGAPEGVVCGTISSVFTDTGCDERTHVFNQLNPTDMDILIAPQIEQMFWLTPYAIRASDLGGHDQFAPVNLNQDAFGGLAADRATKAIFWTEIEFNKSDYVWVYRYNLTDVEPYPMVVYTSPGTTPRGVAVDTTLDALIWTQSNNDTGLSSLLRVDPHDSEPSPTIIHTAAQGRLITDVAIDSPEQHVYWIEDVGRYDFVIRRSNLAGEPVEGPDPLVSMNGFLADHLIVDRSGEEPKIYWTVPSQGKIMRSNLDGSGVEATYLTGLGPATGLAVKPDGVQIPTTQPIEP